MARKPLSKLLFRQICPFLKTRNQLNDIEHDFSALKRNRMYAEPRTSLDEIIQEYFKR
jgi:putative transposase